MQDDKRMAGKSAQALENSDGGKDWGDDLEDQISSQELLKRTARIVAKASDAVWTDSKMGHDSLAVSPTTGFALTTMHSHFDVIPPGARTGRHRHASEAIMLCMSGKGYSMIEDVRHEWEAGDCFVMPSGAWHQHFNESATEPVKYFAVSNWPLTVALGLSYQEFSEISEGYARN